MRNFLLGLLAGVLVCGAFATSTQAQSRAAQQRARQLYAEAQSLFDSGQYAQAEASFRAAYSAVPNPVVLRAIAASQERQGNIAQSIATLNEYLQASPQARDRAEVEARIRDLQSRPATVAVLSTPPGAEIFVDGRSTGQTTPADVSMAGGDHSVELRLNGYATQSQTFTARAATRVRLQMTLVPGAGGPDPMGTGGDGQNAGGGGGGGGGGGSADPSVGVWVFAGIAIAALVAGTVFGFVALSDQSEFDGNPSHEVADRGEAFALAADISFGVAGAAAITAIVLYIVEATSGSSDSAALDPEAPRLTLAPYATPVAGGGARGGLAAQLRF